MKNLHYLLFVGFFAILAGCAKDNLQSDATKGLKITSVTGMVDAGIDIKTWQSPDVSHNSVKPNLSITNRSTVFTTDPLDCPDLPVEDFEEGSNLFIGFTHPLNEFSNNIAFSPGEILPGVVMSASSNHGGQELALFVPPFSENSSQWVGANFFLDLFIIDFTIEGVTTVSMDVMDYFGTSTVVVEVFGVGGLIGSTSVPSSGTGSYLGITTTEDIVRITLHSLTGGFDGNGGAEGVDNLAFGTCQTNIVIDGCDSGVEDYEFEDGSTMMSLILECAENAGNHGEFVSCVAHLTNTWKKAGLITGAEKDAIMDCAGGADIP